MASTPTSAATERDVAVVAVVVVAVTTANAPVFASFSASSSDSLRPTREGREFRQLVEEHLAVATAAVAVLLCLNGGPAYAVPLKACDEHVLVAAFGRIASDWETVC